MTKNKIKISILTPSIRPEGLKVVYDSLKKQTFDINSIEWLVEIGFPEKGCDLNAAYNRMLRRAKGDIIVSLQDFIKIPENALQEIYNIQREDTLITYPVAKVKEWGDKPIWDWRAIETKKIEPIEWEADFASACKSMFFKVGGWDEELDKFFSFDNVSIGFRASMIGYKFLCYNKLKAIGLDHDKNMSHPFKKLRNPDFHNDRLRKFKMGLKLNYLKNNNVNK